MPDIPVDGNEQFREVLRNLRANNHLAPAAGPIEQDWFPIEAVITEKENKKSQSTVAAFWGLRPPARVAKAMASHPGSIIKGIELEIENFPVGLEDAEATGFSFVSDGSLRNNGVEAVSYPNNTAGILAVTKALWTKYGINENNFSDRTSIHVHANVLDFSQDQYKAITLLYQVFEELIFDFIGNDRADNIYCVPWYDAGLTAANHNRIFERPRNWQKYTALNLQPTCEKGTIEFRHMHGHANFELLTAWLAIIDDICLSAKNGSYAELMQSIKDINTTSQYHQLLVRNFPNSHQYLMTNNWEKKLSRGVVEAKLSLE